MPVYMATHTATRISMRMYIRMSIHVAMHMSIHMSIRSTCSDWVEPACSDAVWEPLVHHDFDAVHMSMHMSIRVYIHMHVRISDRMGEPLEPCTVAVGWYVYTHA